MHCTETANFTGMVFVKLMLKDSDNVLPHKASSVVELASTG